MSLEIIFIILGFIVTIIINSVMLSYSYGILSGKVDSYGISIKEMAGGMIKTGELLSKIDKDVAVLKFANGIHDDIEH